MAMVTSVSTNPLVRPTGPGGGYGSQIGVNPWVPGTGSLGDVIGQGLGKLTGALSPTPIDTSRLNALQDKLSAERAGYGGNFNPATDTSLAGQQQTNIDQLAAAAAGRVPSPAEIQLQKQAGINAARQFGLAAALQGRNPGAALRVGEQGSLATQASTNIDAAMLRAKEQEAARQALIQALQSARTGGQNLLGADVDWRKALLGGEVSTATGAADAQAKAAAAENAYKGGLIGTGASLLGSLYGGGGGK